MNEWMDRNGNIIHKMYILQIKLVFNKFISGFYFVFGELFINIKIEQKKKQITG